MILVPGIHLLRVPMRGALLFGGPALFAVLALTQPARAVNNAQIKAAINRGLAFMKQNGMHNTEDGQLAIAGLAMLEGGIDPSDAVMQRIVTEVRERAVTQTATYNLALGIMLLDRIGLEGDIPLIQSLGVRLLFGQSSGGGWSYQCPGPSDAEAKKLNDGVQTLKGSSGPAKVKPSTDVGGSATIDPNVADLIRNRPQFPNAPGGDDNSNTQFAILGLWAARRHGVPVEEALSKTEKRFRSTQQQGGWGYSASQPTVTHSMTCAGLLGLAIGIGHRGERRLRHRRPRDRRRFQAQGSRADQGPERRSQRGGGLQLPGGDPGQRGELAPRRYPQ